MNTTRRTPTLRHRRTTYSTANSENVPEDVRKLSAPHASSVIRKNRAKIIRAVAKKTGEFPLALDAAIDDMITRCKALKLRSPRAEQTVRSEITAMLSSKAIHTHYSTTRRHWFAV